MHWGSPVLDTSSTHLHAYKHTILSMHHPTHALAWKGEESIAGFNIVLDFYACRKTLFLIPKRM